MTAALGAVDLAAAIHSKQVSAVEVVAACLDRIERLNPPVNAIVSLRERESLLDEARIVDQRLAAGEAIGPLAGFPFAVKDLEPVRGLRTTCGSPILKDWVPDADSIMVERLRLAGAILIGRTNTPEFGLGSHTYNPVHGVTRNPYDLTKSAGGSSGGAAVALALRLVPLADGSDYGGSLRNPAGWNNVYGFRPSQGRVPAQGPDAFFPSMGVVGPMARSVADLGLLLSVQAGYDDRAPFSIKEDPAVFAALGQADPRGKLLAWGGDFGGRIPVDPEVLSVCRQALSVFEDLGCGVEEAVPDFDIELVWRAWTTLRAWQVGAGLLPHYANPATRPLLKREAVFEVERGLGVSAFDIAHAGQIRAAWYQAMRSFFLRYDFLILPTAQIFPFDANLDWPREITGRTMETYHEWMKITVPGTMTGGPVLAAPAGFGRDGLPIGIQIIGPNHADLACLQLADAYDRATLWPDRQPPGPATTRNPIRA